MHSNTQADHVVGVFAVDTTLVITMWDDELARLTEFHPKPQ